MDPKFNTHLLGSLGPPTAHRFLVAVSGGMDSVVLAHMLMACGYTFALAHVNYNLRGTDSDLDQKFVEELAQTLKVHCYSKSEPIKPDTSGVQEKARELRYAFFEQVKNNHGFDAVLTAHHSDDQLETFFMRLSRGSGLSGLGGIRERNGFLIRPLLPFSKVMLLDYAKENKLQWREDMSNSSTKYLRNAIRHNVMPAFLSSSPQAAINTLESIRHIAESFDAISEQLTEIKEHWKEIDGSIEISIHSIEALVPQSFWMHHLFSPYGFDHEEVLKLLQTHSGKKSLSNSHELLRERDHLVLHKCSSKATATQDQYLVPMTGMNTPIKLKITTKGYDDKPSNSCVLLDADKLDFPLVLRRWKMGDAFYPSGMSGKKKLSKFFKDEKLSSREKQEQWLLCSGSAIVWVVGKRINRKFEATSPMSSLQIKLQ